MDENLSTCRGNVNALACILACRIQRSRWLLIIMPCKRSEKADNVNYECSS